LVLTLPWVPTANNAYPTSNGRRIKSREAKAYTETVRAIVTNAVGHVEGRLSVMIYCYAPDTRRYDVANREKIVCDALTACGVWADDSQIDELHIYRRAPKPHGAVCVCIQEIG
jgi:crossover junction endodeoxyribonuclease RusA